MWKLRSKKKAKESASDTRKKAAKLASTGSGASSQQHLLSYPVTSLAIQRRGTRFTRSVSVSMNGFRSVNNSHTTLIPRVAGRHNFIASVYDGINGGTASLSMKGLVENKFQALKMTNENITKAFLWFDEQYNTKTMFRDGTTVSMVYGEPWDAELDKPFSPMAMEVLLKRFNPLQNTHMSDNENIADELVKEHVERKRQIYEEMKKNYNYETHVPSNFVFKLKSINLGNSKAMLIRPNGNWIAITEDHTCNNRRERNRILKAGGIIVDGKVNGRHPVTRSIGDRIYKRLEGVPLIDQMIVAIPDFEDHIMLPGDLLLVANNGLFQGKNMDFSTIAGLVSDSVRMRGNGCDLAAVVRDVFEVSIEQGSKENHSAVLLEFGQGLDYVTEPLTMSELVPGPLPKMQGLDREPTTSPRFRYVRAYISDLMRNGYTLEDVHAYHRDNRTLLQDPDQSNLELKPIVYKGDILMQVQEELEKEAQEDSDQEGGYFESDPKFDELNSNDTVTSKSTKNMKFNKMKSQQEIDDEFIHQQTDQYQKKMGDTATSNSFDWDDPDMNSNLRRALKDINPDGVKKQSQKLQFEESYPPKATPLTSFWKNIKERMGK